MTECPRPVLVVEDDPVMREALCDALTLDGYDTWLAADGREALERLREAAPALILLDLRLPGMDGWAFRVEQRMLASSATVPVIIVFAVADVDEHARVMEADAALSKPFKLDELLEIVRRLTEDWPHPTSESAGPEHSDEDLLLALARGEPDALDELYCRHALAAHGLALRVTHDICLAEEAVQDAFVAAWRRATTYRPERGTPRAWLFAIVRNRALNRLRGQGSAVVRWHRLPIADVVAMEDHSASVDDRVIREIERTDVASALAELPREQREALELIYYGGLSHNEIAERFGLPLGTIKGRVRLGLEKMRRLVH